MKTTNARFSAVSFGSGGLQKIGRVCVRLGAVAVLAMLTPREANAEETSFVTIGEELQANITSANAEVSIIHATEGPTKFIDPQLGNVPQLEQLPFKYNNFRLLDKRPLVLQKGSAAPEIKLVNGGSLVLTLTDVKDGRFHVNLNLAKGGSGMNFVASNGVPFFVAGQPYKGGVLVIGVTVRK